MENDLVSVIVLSYKKYDYIFETIDSVLQQTYPSIELIIADDGANNFPQEEISQYVFKKKAENIRSVLIYSNTTNYGTVKSLNIAIKRSKGEYIMNLAADDLFYGDDVVQRVIERMKESKVGVITCRRLMCDEKLNPIRYMPTHGHIKRISRLNTSRKQYAAFLKAEYYEMASGASTYYRRETLFKDGLYDEHYRLLEDWSHFLKITKHYMIDTAYDIVSIKYRIGGISGSSSPILVKDVVKMLEYENMNNKNLSFFERRILKFNIERYSGRRKIVSILKYPDAFVSRFIYKIFTEIYCQVGVQEFKKNLNNICYKE